MKSAEIHKIFDAVMDKNAAAVAYGGCPAFLPEEKDMFLNQAMLEVISNKVTGNNTSRIAFEGSPKRISDLQGLIDTEETKTLEAFNNYVRNEYTTATAALDDKKWIIVNATLFFDYLINPTTLDGTSVTCILLDHTSANAFKMTYDNLDCWIPQPIVTVENNNLLVYIDPRMIKDSTIKKLSLTYIKYPTKIVNTDTTTDYNEVPTNVMYEVIDRAVVLALENIESRRIESKLQINNLSE